MNKRFWATLLALCLFASCTLASFPVYAANDTSSSIDMSSYTADLSIYNYLAYTSATGDIYTNSLAGTYVLSGASNVNITVGDQDANSPLDHDINLELKSLSMGAGKNIYVNPVYNGTRNLTVTVSGASVLKDLVISENAKVRITLQANITLDNVIFGEGSSLEIFTNGYTVTAVSVKGEGALSVYGNGRIECADISAGTLMLSNVTVDGGGSGTVTAENDITANGAKMQDLALFGYTEDVSGKKTITFNGGSFSNVSVVGVAGNSGAFVTVKGINTVSSSLNTQYIYDYSITYTAGETKLSPLAEWPYSYRVKHDALTGGTTQVLGYLNENGFQAQDTIELPSYNTEGYGYDGWKIGDETVTVLPATQTGEITLSAVLRAGTVTIEFILGYTPDASTNDVLPPVTQTEVSSINATITPPSYTRLGYTFGGWRIVGKDTVFTDAFIVSRDDVTKLENEDAYELHLEAVWIKDKFPLRLTLGSKYDTSELIITLNGNDYGFEAFLSAFSQEVTYDAGSKTLSFSENIEYGESLGEYFKRLLGDYPILKETSDSADETFAAWVNSSNGAPLSENDTYQLGGGFLVRPSDKTLVEFHSELKSAPVSLAPTWVSTVYEYTITVEGLGDWAVLVNGTEVSPDANGKIIANKGAQISLRSPIDSDNNITHWKITNADGIEEREYSDGAQYLYYDFTLEADVSLVCHPKNTSSDKMYINLAESPITFAEDVEYNNRTHNGFWYDIDSSEMTPLFYDGDKGKYFYIWDFNEQFWITTNNVATQNQLTIVGAMTGGIHLENCVLVPTDKYANEADGAYLGTVLMRKAGTNLPSGLTVGSDVSGYGNIVIDNTTHSKYTTNIYVYGNNTIAAIFTGTVQSASDYAGELNIYGQGKSSSFLTLGNITYVGVVNVKNLTVTGYDDGYDYLIYAYVGQMQKDNITIENCEISARAKSLHCSFNYVIIKNSKVDINDIFAAYEVQITLSSYVRVRGDIVCNYYQINVQNTSSLVVDGGAYTLCQKDSYGNGRITTSGYVIIKGMGLVGTGFTVSGGGTLIANMVGSSRTSTFSSGTIITNHIMNPATSVSVKGGKYVVSAYTSSPNVAKNGDDAPFFTMSNTQEVTAIVTFSGASVYLFGYSRSNSGVYDAESSLYDTANPLNQFLAMFIDENGDLLEKESLPSSNNVKAAAKEAVENYDNADAECVQFGDSTHTQDTKTYKQVVISGGAIYAAGNLTFFNDTTVTGGTVVCGGTFGSKRDLTVSGGNISAKEVGIAYNCDITENGITRYSKLILNSGKVTTDRIGSLTKKINGVTAHGTVVYAGTEIVSGSGGDIVVVTSLRANYFYDKNVFELASVNAEQLVFTGVYDTEKKSVEDLQMAGDAAFTPPELKAGGGALWLYDGLSGEITNSVSARGELNGDDATGIIVYNGKTSFDLYAAKSEYDLTVNGDAEASFEISYTDGANAGALTSQGTVSLGAKTTKVTIKINDTAASYFKKTIVWYKDSAGLMHNVIATGAVIDENARTITFYMPYADTEIFICEEFTLRLDEYNISFTDNGFALEENTASRREDSVFAYSGNIRITSNNAETYNRIFFESANSGNVTRGTKITLYKVKQSSLGTLYGTVIADGADVSLAILGTLTIAPVNLPTNAKLTFYGATEVPTQDRLVIQTFSTILSYAGVGYSGALGTVTYRNLSLNNGASTPYARFAQSDAASKNSVTFVNCIWKCTNYYTYVCIAKNMATVNIIDCDFQIAGSKDLGQYLAPGCGTLNITGSTLTFSYGGTRGGYHPFGSLGSAVITDSTVTISYNRSDGNATYNEYNVFDAVVVLNGNSVLNTDGRFRLKSIVLNDSSKLIVGGGEGYFLCPSITVNDNAEMSAGYVIVSGFTKDKYANRTEVMVALQAGTVLNGASYSGITVNGGTVNAKYFVGGDLNAKINIYGGKVISAGVGTYGAYFGYCEYIPSASETEFVYAYNRIPSAGTVVNIYGGEVHITSGGYLGGMRAVVNISSDIGDGTVILAENAVLGLTEAQKTMLVNDASSRGEVLSGSVSVNVTGGTVEGYSVSTPYGTTDISGEKAAVNVQYLRAECGEINISDVPGIYYNNIYSGSDKKHNSVGVFVSEVLEARDVNIVNSIVYANRAYTYVENGATGVLSVSNNAHFYTGAEYGAYGDGAGEVIITDENISNIYGNKRYYIHYVLGGDVADPVKNSPLNPEYYIYLGSDVVLEEPTRSGYDFAGWYETEDFSGESFTTLSAMVAKNRTVYAKWTPKKVKFIIKVDRGVLGNIDSERFAKEVEGIAGVLSGDEFIFEKTVEVEYLAQILGDEEGHIYLLDYKLRSFIISELTISNAGYTGDKEILGRTVTKELLEYYLAQNGNGIVLKVSSAQKMRIELTMDLNLNDLGIPKDSEFNTSVAPETNGGTYISSYVDIGMTVATAKGFTDAEGKLITPSAPGYNFGGWYENADCTGDAINAEMIIDENYYGCFYAKWIAKEYYLEFDAGENEYTHCLNIVTKDSEKPDGADTNNKIVVKITYDQPLSTATYYFVYGGLGYADCDKTAMTVLPYAWAEGFIYEGKWCFTDGSDKTVEIGIDTVFNLTNFATAEDWANKACLRDDSLTAENVAVTLFPVLDKITVTYDLNGGTLNGDENAAWRENYQSIELVNGLYVMKAKTYQKALLGYIKNDSKSYTGSSSEYDIVISQNCPHSVEYVSISTTAAYYSTKNTYYPGDYREVISRKGYTFRGWRLMKMNADGTLSPIGEQEYIGYLPQYEDIIVQAVWNANTYDVVLNPYDKQLKDNDQYYSAFSHITPVTVSLTVGKEITDINNWPNRSTSSAWFAYNPSDANGDISKLIENQKRFLLGFTFDPIRPGETIENSTGYETYQKYASYVTVLSNSNNIYSHSEGSETKGTIFRLPSDSEYHSGIISEIKAVPDYPDGSTIDMYAVYRERSLVFVEYYLDGEGNENQKIVASYPWTQWSDYPFADDGYNARTDRPADNEYKLIMWMVNSKKLSSSVAEYPKNENDYQNNIDRYRSMAEDLGTYDIMIYTAYAAQAEQNDVGFSASSDPLTPYSSIYTYAIPGSMQEGTLNYKLTFENSGLTVVDGTDIVNSRFNSANNKHIAIKAMLYNKEGVQVGEEVWLREASDTKNLFGAAVAGGWKIALRVYHTSVVTYSNSYNFDLEIGFNGDHLSNQRITFDGMSIQMTPSVYTVEYEAKLPETPIVTDWNKFNENTKKFSENVAYGAPLAGSDAIPEVEGFTAVGYWKYGDTVTDTLDLDNAAEAAVLVARNAVIPVTVEWTINKYNISASENILGLWYITIDGTPLGASGAEVDYRTKITFSLKGTGADAFPEFVWLDFTAFSKRESLEVYAEVEGGKYSFTMPASDIEAIFEKIITLYLENGTIDIDADGYTQNSKTTVWHGFYTIWMDANNNTDASSTAYCLNFDGALSDRTIKLGNIKISSADSITLAENTAVSLTVDESTVEAKNILVPETATLTVNSVSNQKMGKLILAPDAGFAAIGGKDAANGEINLESVNVELLLVPSYSSGIGSGNRTSGGESIVIEKCTVTVKEISSASDVYHGTWIGGAGVSSVTIINTRVKLGAGSDVMTGPEVLNATTVTVESSVLGESADQLTDPIYAEDTLEIENSSIYQSMYSGIALGTSASGTVSIKNSVVYSRVITHTSLYTGEMKIYDADSNVVIANTKILETNNGDVTISAEAVTQGGKTHSHDNSYLVISAFGNAVSSLTVNSLANTAKFTAKDAKIGTLNVNSDVEIAIEGTVNVNLIRFSVGKTLSVSAGNDGKLSLGEGFSAEDKGNFNQTGGELDGQKIAISGDMMLNGVVVNAESVGSLGTGNTTTTVTINGGTVTADRVGALGTKNATFTFAVLENSPVIYGTLVQDHYRLEYQIGGAYDTTALDKVLRSERDANETVTYTPSIPDNPTVDGAGAFLFWYIKDTEGKVFALTNDAVSVDKAPYGLIADYIEYGSTGSDGTVTLVIYAWMNISVDSVIANGKIIGAVSGNNEATIYPTGVWTAQFTVKGTVLAGETYKLVFETALPAGTMLTLGVMSGSVPKFYYYKCDGTEDQIDLSEFKLMGGTSAPVLSSGELDPEATSVLIVCADFHTEKATENTFRLVIGGNVESEQLGYGASEAADVTAEEGKVSVTLPNTLGESENFYLVIEIQGADIEVIPYGASVMINNVAAARISDNKWMISLENDTTISVQEYSWNLSGFESGEYTVKFSLTSVQSGTSTSLVEMNPLGNVLASRMVRGYKFSAPAIPEMSVTTDSEYTLLAGEEHKILFNINTEINSTVTPDNIYVTAEMFGENGYAPVEQISVNVFTDESGQQFAEVLFDKSLSKGVYRICFSLDKHSENGSIYFTFFLEDEE